MARFAFVRKSAVAGTSKRVVLEPLPVHGWQVVQEPDRAAVSPEHRDGDQHDRDRARDHGAEPEPDEFGNDDA